MTDLQLFAKVLGFLQHTIAYSNEEMAKLDEIKGLVRDRLAQPNCPPCNQDCDQGRRCPRREWVGLTDDEIKEIIGPWGPTPIKGYTRELFDKIEAKLKEKNS